MTGRRTRQMLGGTRTSSLHRFIWLIVLALASPVLVPVALGAGLLYMVVDVLKGVVMDSNASGNGLIMGTLKGIPMWFLDHVMWTLFGDRDFPGFIPSRA